MASHSVQQLYGPNGAEGHLVGHSRHGGVSHCCNFAVSSKLDLLRTIWVISFARRVAVHTTDWRVGASRAFLANGKGARMLSGVVWPGADGAAGVVPAKCSRMSIGLAVVAMGAPSVWDVVIQLAFAVAHDKVLTSDRIFLDITGQRHDNRRCCLMLAAFCWCQPAWHLPLYELRIVGSNAIRDFRR